MQREGGGEEKRGRQIQNIHTESDIERHDWQADTNKQTDGGSTHTACRRAFTRSSVAAFSVVRSLRLLMQAHRPLCVRLGIV